jgi:hypothetical protein
MRTIHNHKSKIDDFQQVGLKSLTPGMIIQFKYSGKNVSDKNPMILFLNYNTKYGSLDGLNLNYLSNYRFKKLFEGFSARTTVGDASEKTSGLIYEDYTLVQIPPITKLGRPNSRSEYKVEMKRMYKNFVGKRFSDIYRSYTPNNIKNLRIINLKDY